MKSKRGEIRNENNEKKKEKKGKMKSDTKIS